MEYQCLDGISGFSLGHHLTTCAFSFLLLNISLHTEKATTYMNLKQHPNALSQILANKNTDFDDLQRAAMTVVLVSTLSSLMHRSHPFCVGTPFSLFGPTSFSFADKAFIFFGDDCHPRRMYPRHEIRWRWHMWRPPFSALLQNIIDVVSKHVSNRAMQRWCASQPFIFYTAHTDSLQLRPSFSRA